MKNVILKCFGFLPNLVFVILLIGLITFNSCESQPIKDSENKGIQKDSSIIQYPTIYMYEGDNGISWENKSEIEIKFCDTCERKEAKIKFRGGMSNQYNKHSFSLSLKHDTILFEDWDKDDDFILNANYIDKTLVRHRLSYDLFSFFNPSNLITKSHYTELYLNGIYQGIYVIMEEVDRSLVDFSTEDSNALLIKDGPLFWSNLKELEPELVQFQQKYPKIQSQKHIDTLMVLWEFIHESSDEVFTEQVGEVFEIQNIIDWHLLLLLTNNGDGVIKNYYWYTKSDTPWKVIPWDYDDSYGRNGDGTIQTFECDWERNTLLNRLFELNVNNYKQTLHQKWNELTQNGLSVDLIQNKINQYKEELDTGALNRNFETWPVNGQGYSDSMTYDQEVKILLNYFPKRINYIDSLTNSWVTL